MWNTFFYNIAYLLNVLHCTLCATHKLRMLCNFLMTICIFCGTKAFLQDLWQKCLLEKPRVHPCEKQPRAPCASYISEEFMSRAYIMTICFSVTQMCHITLQIHTYTYFTHHITLHNAHLKLELLLYYY